jgi:hypothetical protein
LSSEEDLEFRSRRRGVEYLAGELDLVPLGLAARIGESEPKKLEIRGTKRLELLLFV